MALPVIGDLHLDELSIRLGGVSVVERVSCAIPISRWTGVIGANGSGKTTLLRAIAGRLPIDAGRLTVGRVDRTADRAWRARRIGFSPEAAGLPEALSGAELFDIVTDGRVEDIQGDLRPLRDALEIDAIATRPIGACSAGMRQRIAIFCAFVGGQRTVILDEPFNWLDPPAAFDVRAALRVLVDGGLTLVTALHDLSTLASSCDRGLLMRGGALALTIDEAAMRDASRNPSAFERSMIDHLRRSPGG